MRHAIPLGLLAGLAFLPAGATAQMVYDEPTVIAEPPLMMESPADEEPGYVPDDVPTYAPENPTYAPQAVGLDEQDARDVAMMNGLVSVDEVDDDWHDNFKVKGRDASGDRVVVTVDKDTGAVLDIDD